MAEYYDRDGKPLTYAEYRVLILKLHDEKSWNAYKRVAVDTVTDINGIQARISTVWLGLDHSFSFLSRPTKPLIFETMVFGGEWDAYCDRYSIWSQAVAGHDQLVERVKHEHAPYSETYAE